MTGAVRLQDHGRRAIPIQERAQKTVEKLAAAAKEAIAEVGMEHFTTSQVAEIADVSIGVVYRYFPDRLALLEYVYPGGFLTVDSVEGLVRLPESSVVLTRFDEAYQRIGDLWASPRIGGSTVLSPEQLLEDGPLRIVFQAAAPELTPEQRATADRFGL